MAATFVANMIRYKEEGYKPDRDIILALETDEEILDADGLGIQWLLKNHRDLIDAEFALNEGGSVGLKRGKAIRNSVQTSEKVSVSYRLEVTNKGGHSSVPSSDNAIYHLAEGLARLGKFAFPLDLNATTRQSFERTAELETPEVAADIRVGPLGRAGSRGAGAALRKPRLQRATAHDLRRHHARGRPRLSMRCRRRRGPSSTAASCRTRRSRTSPRRSSACSPTTRSRCRRSTPSVLSPPSAIDEALLAAIEKTSAEFWPGTPVVPVMSAGATDGSYLRNAGIPTFGHSGLASDVDDVRAHGKDERVQVKSFHDGQEYLYRLVKRLSGEM